MVLYLTKYLILLASQFTAYDLSVHTKLSLINLAVTLKHMAEYDCYILNCPVPTFAVFISENFEHNILI